MKTTNRDNCSVNITLDDIFDFKCIEEFREAYESLPYQNTNEIFVDFQHTRYMDSSALGMLLNLKNFVSEHNVRIAIINTNDQIKKILKISRFDQKFDIQ